MSYIESRKWADQYSPAMNQVAAHLMYTNNLMSVHFRLPTPDEDRKLGIDMWLYQERTKFAYRVRKAKDAPYFMEGFTIRTAAKKGPSELEKLQGGTYADFLLYGLASDNYGEIQCAVLIDMNSVGAQLNKYPHLIEDAKKGKGFIDFSYDDFPFPVVVGMYGVKHKGEMICH
jgi:hypothetical protein